MRPLLLSAAACIVLSAVIPFVTSSSFMTATAISLGGTAVVLLVSASFLAVGQSEDRQRALDAAERDDHQNP